MQGSKHTKQVHKKHVINKDTTKANKTDAKIDLIEKIATEMAGQIVNRKNVIFNKEETELKGKVNMLEAVVQKLVLNMIKLEGEFNEQKT